MKREVWKCGISGLAAEAGMPASHHFGLTWFYRTQAQAKTPGQETQPTTRGQDVMGSYFGITCLDRHVFGAIRHSGQKSTVEGWSDSRRQPIVSVITI